MFEDKIITVTESGVAITPSPEHEKMAHEVAINYLTSLGRVLRPGDYAETYLEVYTDVMVGLKEGF